MNRPVYMRQIDRLLFAQPRKESRLWVLAVVACGLLGLLFSSKG